MLLTFVFLTSHTALHPGPRGPISDGSPGRFDCRGTLTFAGSSACSGPWENDFRPENAVCGAYIICLVEARLHSLDVLRLLAWPWTLCEHNLFPIYSCRNHLRWFTMFKSINT